MSPTQPNIRADIEEWARNNLTDGKGDKYPYQRNTVVEIQKAVPRASKTFIEKTLTAEGYTKALTIPEFTSQTSVWLWEMREKEILKKILSLGSIDIMRVSAQDMPYVAVMLDRGYLAKRQGRIIVTSKGRGYLINVLEKKQK